MPVQSQWNTRGNSLAPVRNDSSTVFTGQSSGFKSQERVKAEISKGRVGAACGYYSDSQPAVGESVDSKIASTKKATSLAGCRLLFTAANAYSGSLYAIT